MDEPQGTPSEVGLSLGLPQFGLFAPAWIVCPSLDWLPPLGFVALAVWGTEVTQFH